MEIYLVDGTYELFRYFFAVPGAQNTQGQEIAATRGVIGSMLSLLESGVTHLGVATDHVIESFRNELYAGYKTGTGIPEELFSQFQLLEDALTALGVKLWAEVYFEADDALASAAHKATADAVVGKVFICSPDKDLAQCVVDDRIVQMDRVRKVVRDENATIEKFGVRPESIAEYLALVGDTADGYPGLPGWGAKAASTVLMAYRHFENIPRDPSSWEPPIRNARKLAETLFDRWDEALLYRTLATLRLDVPVFDNIEELRWRGCDASFAQVCEQLKAPQLLKRARALSASRA